MAILRRRRSLVSLLDLDYAEYYSYDTENSNPSENSNIFDSTLSTSKSENSSLVFNETNFESFNQTRNSMRSHRKFLTSCGTVPFCDYSANFKCLNTTIKNCEQCSAAKSGIYAFFLFILGLSIFVGNLIVIGASYRRRRTKKWRKIDTLKVSLAFADLLTGIELLIFIPLNVSWTVELTFKDLVLETLKARGTPLANFGTAFLAFGYTSSIYHLMFMGMERLYAITVPMSYKAQKEKSIIFGIIVVWLLAILSSTAFLWFPSDVIGGYMVTLTFYAPVLKRIGSGNMIPLLLTLIVFLVIPYLIMICSSIWVAVLISTKLKNPGTKCTKTKENNPERKAFITVMIIQLGFTITMIPLVVVSALVYNKTLTCRNLTTPYVITFYLSMTNSLVNVFIYNVRDKTFRASVSEFLSISSASKRSSSESSKTSGKFTSRLSEKELLSQ